MHLNNNVVIFSHHQGRKMLENAQDFFVKTKIKTKTFISRPRPRPRLVFLSSRRLSWSRGLHHWFEPLTIPLQLDQHWIQLNISLNS